MNDHPRDPARPKCRETEHTFKEGCDQALNASRTQQAFLYQLRHELRTPLNAIIGYCEMLLEDAAEQAQEDFIPDLQRIHTASGQLLARVNDILDPTRLEAGQLAPDPENSGANLHLQLRTPLNAMLGYCEMLLEDAAERAQQNLIPDLQRIHVAAQRILALIHDLVNFSSMLKPSDQDLDLQARDTWAISQEAATPISTPLAGKAETGQTDHGSLLVVDDQESNRDMLSRRLERRGYRVTVAEDGRQAIELITTQTFDLVLLDIMMPGISGLEVLRVLRARYSATDLPVIMATVKDQSSDVVEALHLGANDYVTKPFDFPVVLARLQTQLSLKRAMDEIHRMAQQLELRNQFIRATFGRYLTDEVVASLLDSPEGLQLGGEQRQVTILMADLRGFASLSGQLAPEQVVVILNRYLGTMAEVIMQYQGTIDEFMGDAIFVIFGAPIWRQDHAQRAVACAVAMQLAMDTVNQQNRRDGLPEVEMGIGVNTGEVVVGNFGSHKRMKYGVVGSHVNFTSRIESYTVGGQILISETTLQEAGPIVRMNAQMQVEAKGIANPLTLYEVRGIGGEYDLFLPEREDVLFHLHQEILLRYTVLEGKHLGGTMFEGSFVKLSGKGGEVRSNYPVTPWSDIKMRLLGADGEEIPGDLYGKVVEKPTDTRASFAVHFTFIPPEVAAFLRGLSSSSASLTA
ncbi:MAG TPA: adenylate/guanylate cyclase domain-containing protein [Candidatus Tectomicrobia bacterium]|nr:adenylate/guanylate cyclase domain-containing protein [Candidatus Tectomicrobia bacterium]